MEWGLQEFPHAIEKPIELVKYFFLQMLVIQSEEIGKSYIPSFLHLRRHREEGRKCGVLLVSLLPNPAR